MKINLQHVDTTNMSKEARLAIQAKLKKALSELQAELSTMDEAESLNTETVNNGTETFCGITFDFEGMSKEDLLSNYEEARKFWSAILAENLPNSRIDNTSKFFFCVEFKLGTMSREQLASIKIDAKALLNRIEKQIKVLDNTSSDSIPP